MDSFQMGNHYWNQRRRKIDGDQRSNLPTVSRNSGEPDINMDHNHQIRFTTSTHGSQRDE